MTTDDDELVDPHGELVPRIAAIVRKKQPYQPVEKVTWSGILAGDIARVHRSSY